MKAVLNVLSYAVTHKAAIAAALTLLTMILAALGVVIPHVPAQLVTAVGVILTGIFGVTTDDAAYISGVIDALDGHYDAAVSPGGSA